MSLDPPYNEHLVSDIGGLNLALVAVLIFAAVSLERRLVLAALTGLGFEAVLTIVLLIVTFRSGRPAGDRLP